MQLNCMLRDRGFSDINPMICGAEECEPGHSFGPYVRQYYLLHYVLSGEGTYERGGKTYRLKAGQFFLIYPDEITTYTADSQSPWTYVWIGLTGRLASRLDRLELPVGALSDLPFRELYGMLRDDFPGWEHMREEYLVTVVHRVMAELFAADTPSRHYVSRVKAYIRSSYMQEVTVEQIAREMSVDRRHLSRQFKKRYGVGIQEYLLSVRMENAARFLKEGYSVGESCELSGYKDRSNFSKTFHARFGVWPSEYAVRR